MKKLILFFLLFHVKIYLVFSQPLSSEIVKHIKKSTVFIHVTHDFPITDETYPISGTGFFINKYGYLVTNYHVIQPILSIYGTIFPAPLSEIKIILNSGTEKHKSYNAYVVSVDKENDLAILRINESIKTSFIKLEEPKQLIEATQIWIFGYPYGEAFSVIQRGPEITVSNGTISALRHDDTGILSTIQVDASVKQGNSGGPVINKNGEVIGIINSTLGTANMSFAVPLHYLTDLTKKTNLDTCFYDYMKYSVSSEPSGASVFIDWKFKGKTPVQNIKIKPGIHSVCISKYGFNSEMKEQTFDNNKKLHVKLFPNQNIPVSVQTNNINNDELDKTQISFFKIFLDEKITDSTKILLQEDFSDIDRFNEWKQNTGGYDTHTWFLEKDVLHQFDSDGLLHAISIGDSTWENYVMRADIKISGTENDSRAGLIFRETSEGFYLFRIHKKSDKAQLAYHSKQPFGWFIIKEKKLDLDISDEWYSLSACVNENIICCFLNDEIIFSAEAEYSDKGNTGFYSVESKASFDNLLVYRIDENLLNQNIGSNDLVSFWFSDYFNLKSNWWYQYTDIGIDPLPWHFSDGGCLQPYDDNKTHYCEFKKYNFENFTMSLILTLAQGNESSSFEMFFRKNNEQEIIIRFQNEDKKVYLIKREGEEEKILKRENLPDKFFNNSLLLNLYVNNNSVSLESSKREILNFKSKKLPVCFGSFGFATNRQKIVLHQLSLFPPKKEK